LIYRALPSMQALRNLTSACAHRNVFHSCQSPLVVTHGAKGARLNNRSTGMKINLTGPLWSFQAVGLITPKIIQIDNLDPRLHGMTTG
jgi:hypothetical protein